MRAFSLMQATVLALAAIAASPAPLQARSTNQDDTGPAPELQEAVYQIEQQNYDRAIVLLQDVVRTAPSNADAYNYLGFSHRKAGRYDDAFAAYRRALALNPQHLGANEYIGEAYLETGDLAMAERHLATLAALCGLQCEEYLDLKAAMEAFTSRGGRGAGTPRSARGGW